MESNLNFLRLPGRSVEINNHIISGNYSTVFFPRQNSYINELHLFQTKYNTIPNFIHEIEIDCRKANKEFILKYSELITDKYYTKLYIGEKKINEYDDIFYFLYDDLIVYFDTGNNLVRFLFKKTDIVLVEQIISVIKKHKKRKKSLDSSISLLINSEQGIRAKPLTFTKQKLDIAENYNDDFLETHQIILKRLCKKNDKGLVLLHGKPGTGKTSYIKYLISIVKKKVIFLPPNLAGSITNPGLISVLIENPNSVLIIEDAENIVVDRERDGDSPVSALLNISDGLLSDCLNIQIICSFNTDISKVDSALMRKGRLIAKYEFKELEVNKAIILSQKLGFNTNIQDPMTLTAIYNQHEKDFIISKKRNQIGFVNN